MVVLNQEEQVELAKRKQNLKRHGWGFVKGKFGAVKLEDIKRSRRSGKRSGRRSGRRTAGRRSRGRRTRGRR